MIIKVLVLFAFTERFLLTYLALYIILVHFNRNKYLTVSRYYVMLFVFCGSNSLAWVYSGGQ